MFLQLWLLLITQQVAASGDWGYHGENGPSHWFMNHPLCNGSRQSPIDIEEEKASFSETKIKFSSDWNKRQKVEFQLKNNGHSAVVTYDKMYEKDIKPNLEIEAFGQKWGPLQFHFHWGSDDSKGSEHTVNGKQFSAEMHFVFMNQQYGNVSKAVKFRNGLLVLGTFIKIGTWNKELKRVIRELKNIEFKDEESKARAFFPWTPLKMLPDNTDQFWYYNGSLTTPECNEAVSWVVFKEPITISGSQMKQFRSLKLTKKGDESSESSKFISDNFRPTQALNCRKVYKTFDNKKTQNNFINIL